MPTQRSVARTTATSKVAMTTRKAFLGNRKAAERYRDEQEAKFRIRQFEEHGPSFRRYLDDPLTKTGSFPDHIQRESRKSSLPCLRSILRLAKNEHVVETLPRVTTSCDSASVQSKGTPSERHFVDLGAVPEKDQFKQLATFQITGSTDEPQTIEVPVQLAVNWSAQVRSA